ncbi:hypothetical protein HDV01_002512 [Terramyces sp. JEL0728]|nr:hypothetical protein HDV01_002512 [Terramyces sp. JEL0728]
MTIYDQTSNNDTLVTPELDQVELNQIIAQYSKKLNGEIKLLESALRARKQSPTKKADEKVSCRRNAQIVLDELYIYLKSMQELAPARRNAELEILNIILDQTQYGEIPKEIMDLRRTGCDIEISIRDMEEKLRKMSEPRNDLNFVAKMARVQYSERDMFNFKHEIVKSLLDYKLIALELNTVEIDWIIQAIENLTKKSIASFGYVLCKESGKVAVPLHSSQQSTTTERNSVISSATDPTLIEQVFFAKPKLLQKSDQSELHPNNRDSLSEQDNVQLTMIPCTLIPELGGDSRNVETSMKTKSKADLAILPPFRENSFVKNSNTPTVKSSSRGQPKNENENPQSATVPVPTNSNEKQDSPVCKANVKVALKKQIIKKYPNGVPQEEYSKVMKERNALVEKLLDKVDRERFVEKWELVHAQGELGSLKLSLQKLQLENERLQKGLELKSKNDQLRAQVQQLKDAVSKEQEQKANQELILQDLKKKLAEKTRHEQKYIKLEDYNAIKNRNKELENKHQQLQIEGIKKQVVDLSADETENQNLRKEIERLNTIKVQKTILDKTNQDLRLEIDRLNTLQSKHSKIEIDNQVLQLEVERLSNLDISKAALESENQSLQTEIDRLSHIVSLKETQLDIRIETPKEFAGGIPKKEYERAIEERNRFAEMCKILSLDMLENGVDQMYITVAKKVGEIKQRLAYSDKQNGRLRNQVILLKQEIEQLKSLPISPGPSEYESEVCEEFVWLSQLESIIASETF